MLLNSKPVECNATDLWGNSTCRYSRSHHCVTLHTCWCWWWWYVSMTELTSTDGHTDDPVTMSWCDADGRTRVSVICITMTTDKLTTSRYHCQLSVTVSHQFDLSLRTRFPVCLSVATATASVVYFLRCTSVTLSCYKTHNWRQNLVTSSSNAAKRRRRVL